MQQDIDAMTTAFGVLTAVTNNRIPGPADLEALRRYAPLPADNPPVRIRL
jgi:hypothetical protein